MCVPVGGTCPRFGWAPQRVRTEGWHSKESHNWLAGLVTEHRCCLHLEMSSLPRPPLENLLQRSSILKLWKINGWLQDCDGFKGVMQHGMLYLFQNRTMTKHACCVTSAELLAKGGIFVSNTHTCGWCNCILTNKILRCKSVWITRCRNDTTQGVLRLNGNQIHWHTWDSIRIKGQWGKENRIFEKWCRAV